MRIGIDVDDVLVPFKKRFYEYIKKKVALELDWRSPHYDLVRDVGLPVIETSNLVWDFQESREFQKTPPIKGAIKGVIALKELGDLYAITARAEFLKESTQNFLDSYFQGLFSGLEMGNHYNYRTGGPEFSKKQLCEKCSVGLLIEDQTVYASSMNCEVPVILFDKPWNQGYEAENVYRARNWEEIVKIAQNLSR